VRMLILQKPMNYWAVFSRGSGNGLRLRGSTGARLSCSPI